jgi:hypothetical protein
MQPNGSPRIPDQSCRPFQVDRNRPSALVQGGLWFAWPAAIIVDLVNPKHTLRNLARSTYLFIVDCSRDFGAVEERIIVLHQATHDTSVSTEREQPRSIAMHTMLVLPLTNRTSSIIANLECT